MTTNSIPLLDGQTTVQAFIAHHELTLDEFKVIPGAGNRRWITAKAYQLSPVTHTPVPVAEIAHLRERCPSRIYVKPVGWNSSSTILWEWDKATARMHPRSKLTPEGS